MLAAGRPVCRRDLCRSLSTFAESASTSTSDYTPPRRDQTPRHRRPEPQNNGKLFLRPFDGVPSMPDAFAIIRAVEAKYGKLKSFRLARDVDINTNYAPFMWVDLEDPSTFKGSDIVKVRLPDVDYQRSGGVGLDDLQGMLGPAKPQTQWADASEQIGESHPSGRMAKVIDVKVQLSAAEESPRIWIQSPTRLQNKQFLVSDAFIKWGGFATAGTHASENFDQVLKKSRVMVEEHKSDLKALEDQGLPNKDLVKPPSPPPEPSPFNYEFDDVVAAPEVTQVLSEIPAQEQGRVTATSMADSIKDKEARGIPLTNRERTLRQAAHLARTTVQVKTSSPGKRHQHKPQSKGPEKPQTEGEKKGFQDKLWNIVGGKWF